MALNEKWKHPVLHMLHVRLSLQSHKEKVKKNMDQINKADINNISISYLHEKNQLYFSMSLICLDYEIFVMQNLL